MSIQYRLFRFRKKFNELNIKIIGSYYSSKISCNENEFYDYMHLRNSCMIKITNQIN